MKLLSWNVRGLGGIRWSRTFRDLKDLICVHKPEVVFLIETKMTSVQMGKLKLVLGMDGILSVPRIDDNGGASGGLCLLWRGGVVVSFLSSSFFHIDVLVKWEDGLDCRVTGFYGEPNAGQRFLSWELLRQLALGRDGPWMCCGDFNEILSISEKTGHTLRSQRQIDDFKFTVEECGLYAFDFTGYEFTWDNRRVGDANVQARIDRGFGNLSLIQKWGGFTSHHLVAMASDHCPLLIESDPPFNGRGDGLGRRRFTFEEMWTTDEDCGKMIQQLWGVDCGNSVLEKIKHVSVGLKDWEKEKFGSVRRSIKELREVLDGFQRQAPTEINLQQRREVEVKLDQVLFREEIMWSQRSRVNWLKYAGDGVPHDDIFNAVTSRISTSQVQFLEKSFSRAEVEVALKNMGPTKAPGPDGMPPIFYQKYWSVVGDDVIATCLGFLNGSRGVEELNHTLIALIPKVANPKKVTEFRPISLCNVIYKIISKTLANRLKTVLSDVISEFQSAFVPNRLIHDNVVAAFEILHNLKRRGRKSRQKVAVKLDMAKAYDRVEWRFIRRMLEVMGFPHRFCYLIMQCIQTVSYSVLFQGRPFGKIIPSRGLRQGDPISPYLFLLVAEGFSALLRRASRDKYIHGVSIARGAPSISHLFFADDSLLFCDASAQDCDMLKEIFEIYEKASGQKINTDKSAMCFSPRTLRSDQEVCSNILDMKVVPCHERYLGLPTVAGRDKKKMFRGLADRVWNRVNGWEGKILSKAGKEVLIKSVAQAIPTYTMSVFQLPIGTCKEINSCLARFWWGKPGGKGIHWRTWRDLCMTKGEGGLGFRDLILFNQALVAKQGWRLLKWPNSLVARMLMAKYYPNGDFLGAVGNLNDSFVWKSFLWGRELLLKGVRWRVSNGENIKVFKDPWVPGIDGFKLNWKVGVDINIKVSDLLSGSGGWNIDMLNQVGTVQEQNAILDIPLVQSTSLDRQVWHYNKSGAYSVKSGYWLALKSEREKRDGNNGVPVVTEYWRHLWKLKVPPKMLHFLWRCSNGFLPCKASLFWRKIAADSICFRCQQGEETPLHATWDCSMCVVVPLRAGFYSKLHPGSYSSFSDLITHAISILTVDEMKLLVVFLWTNWNERCAIYHGEQPKPSDVLYESSVSIWKGILDVERMVSIDKMEKRGTAQGRNRRWTTPTLGSIKMNCDASVSDDRRQVGVGVVFRDARGGLVGAMGQRIDQKLRPRTAELFAIKAGLDFALENGWDAFQVESDCLEAVMLLLGDGECLTDDGVIVEEIKNLMDAMHIPGVLYIPREANKAAHSIARFVARDFGRLCWLGVGPSWLMQIIYDEVPVTRSGSRNVSCGTSSTSSCFNDVILSSF
ncbi:hypothetical protein M0R45_030213 [Rubus argutus]|uniref:Reverse transcriptase domain-containing protein n=1 Tax=Rubus argutus TaxID=59490 RepID=A0AAW1WAU0_RUBAR